MSIPADNRITTITVAAKANLRKIIKNHNLPTAHPTLNVQSTNADLEYKYMGTLPTADAEDTVAAALVADHSSTPVLLTSASTPSILVVTFSRAFLVRVLLGTSKGETLAAGLMRSSVTTHST
jgi:hypothetical protein